jgi:hypothetical protein
MESWEANYIGQLLLNCGLGNEKACELGWLYLYLTTRVSVRLEDLLGVQVRPPVPPEPPLQREIDQFIRGDVQGDPTRSLLVNYKMQPVKARLTAVQQVRDALTKVMSSIDEDLEILKQQIR